MQIITRRRFLEGSTAGIAAAGWGVSSLGAQDWARQAVDKSPRRHESVKVQNGARSLDTFVAYPQSQGKSPAVVLVHDVIAYAPWVENVADRFAEAGYLAIAPDMLSGRSPEERQAIQVGGRNVGPARRLPIPQVDADLNALVDYAKKLAACKGKVCVVGFSWGGDVAFRFATIPSTTEQMKAAGKFYDPVTFDGADHGFMQAGAAPNAKEANKKAWDASWVKLKALRPKFN
jgi:carboxymethylenebutenolidase